MKDFCWFQGVVEDRGDPLKLGRVRGRCLGYHTEDKMDLPTQDLPWAHPIQPVTSAAMSGIGTAPIGPVEGTWVFGFFRDGDLAQLPVILGTIGGESFLPNTDPNIGFKDPNKNYPLKEGPNAAGLTAPGSDTNSLARGESGLPIQNRQENLDQFAKHFESMFTFAPVAEPSPRYDAQYPFNHVKFTESGHVEEFDDTPGAERIHRYHRSGTFEEIGPDGERVLKVVNKNYSVTLGDNDVHVKGNANIQVDGESSIILSGATRISALSDLSLNVLGDFDLNALGKINITGLETSIRGFPIKLNSDIDPEDIPT